jgi:ribosome-binding protein aMBF1 (putative translation factor)
MKMRIENTDDLLKIVEAARIERGLSERQLSAKANMSHGSYWWWKTHAGTTSFNVAMRYINALGLQLNVKPL